MRCAATSPTTRDRSSSNSHRRCFARYCSAAASSASPEKAIERSTVSSPWRSRGRSAGESVTVRSGSRFRGALELALGGDREREVGERRGLHAHALAGERRELLARPGLRVEQVVHERDDGQARSRRGEDSTGRIRVRRVPAGLRPPGESALFRAPQSLEVAGHAPGESGARPLSITAAAERPSIALRCPTRRNHPERNPAPGVLPEQPPLTHREERLIRRCSGRSGTRSQSPAS